eukprot:GHVS01027649.1.p1 GENE.GHVS01027649.1~~GHVS01027649.1.p1  ORF type:complete len:219 (+),score=47.85 GHVS01027649.1:49-705(+)
MKLLRSVRPFICRPTTTTSSAPFQNPRCLSHLLCTTSFSSSAETEFKLHILSQALTPFSSISFLQRSLSLSDEEAFILLQDHPSLPPPPTSVKFSRSLTCLRSAGMLDWHLRELTLSAPEVLLLGDEEVLSKKVCDLAADGVPAEDFPKLLRLEEYDEKEDTERYQAQLEEKANRGKLKTKQPSPTVDSEVEEVRDMSTGSSMSSSRSQYKNSFSNQG